MKRVALFGTSADPPTSGHQAILNWLSQHYDLVAVWASDNPFKSHQTPLEHRSRMLRLLIEEINSTWHNICLFQELSSPRTLETVQKARAIWGMSVDFTVVIGSDLVSQMPRWYRVEDWLRQVQLLVVPRPGYPIEDSSLEELRQMGAHIAIAHLNAPAVSSTAYRENGNTKALTTTVKEYINRERLYECQDAARKK
ncbi:nicotinate-nucleotide adenylyltransferase [Trichocoleus sp. FACHB-90]|uniref:nicotinate-nucleotide adenylyltransferase n=1 Tax=Cyanophyceae TaxID=3028117 RepID=UPI0016859AC6|nr:nicotinate-nucleotide adenylyltransferase [Trichocoleus sp. FACHB-90]MBD1926805.1 nicotinate-nucleotide adenylyltransferase [Trichocoleus sp. FACHB-90]